MNMPGRASPTREVNRRDPLVAGVLRSWRELTSPPHSRRAGPGEETLVACSGGADSSALVLMLASSRRPGIVAHVVHDLRPAREALADRDAARRLAARVGWPFAERRVRVRHLPGNAEANARRARYAALTDMALTHGVRFVATAHHADDQLETVLMRLLRGAGPTKLAGVHATRTIRTAQGRVNVIRPMLGVWSADARAICRSVGWRWREDRTNRDTTLLRNRLRASVVPSLRALRPDLPARLQALCEQSRSLDELLARAAHRLLARAKKIRTKPRRRSVTRDRADAGDFEWKRDALARTNPSILGTTLRLAVLRCSLGRTRDRLPARTLGAIARAINDADGTRRTWSLRGAMVAVAGDAVRVAPRAG